MQSTPSSQIKALIELLSRENGSRAVLLKEELARIMQQQPQDLQQVIERDFHAAVPAALIRAMQEVYWEELAQQIAHLQPGTLSLEDALALATRFANPAFSQAEINRYLDGLTQNLRPLLRKSTSNPLETMQHYFFEQLQYRVLPLARDVKDFSFGHFLQNKQGACVCACALYAVCAKRLGLQAEIVDLAGRLMTRWQDPATAAYLFIDPLSDTALTLQDCQNYVAARNLTWQPSLIVVLPNRVLLRRIFSHMIFVLNKLRDERRLHYLRRYMDNLKEE